MELRHLRYFVVVADEGNFTRAAQKLNMQQPPLSQQIKALEDELGFVLFHRHPKGADLTIGGATFLKEAKSILENVAHAAVKASHAARGIEGSISVGFTSSAAAHPLVPQILRSHRARKPGVEVEYREGNAAEISQAIRSGKLDIGFLRMPVGNNAELSFHRLAEEELLLVLPEGHHHLKSKTANKMQVISLKSLRDEPFILVRKPGAPGMYSNLVAACERAGFTPNIVAEVDRMLSNICLVAAGVGISVVPASMKGLHAGMVTYCRIRESGADLDAPLTMVSRKSEGAPAVQHFVAEARRLVSDSI